MCVIQCVECDDGRDERNKSDKSVVMNVTTKLHQIKLGTCDDCRWNALGKRGEPDDRDDNNDASSEWMSVIAVLVLNVVMIMEMRSGKDERDQRDVLFNYFLGPDLDHVHWIHASLWCHVLKNLASSHFISEENTKKGKKTNHERTNQKRLFAPKGVPTQSSYVSVPYYLQAQ